MGPWSTRHSWAWSPSFLILPTAGLSLPRCLYGPHVIKLQVLGTANTESTKSLQPQSFLSPLSFQGEIQVGEDKVTTSLPSPNPAAFPVAITGQGEGPQTPCRKRRRNSPQPVLPLNQTRAHQHSLINEESGSGLSLSRGGGVVPAARAAPWGYLGA